TARSHRAGEYSVRGLAAAAELELLALVLDLRDDAEDLDAELAVGLADDLLGALVLDDVAGLRVDHDVAARAIVLPALHRVDHLLAVAEIAIERLHGVEDGRHRVVGGGRHEVRRGVLRI